MKYYIYVCEIEILIPEDELYDPHSDPDAYMAESIQQRIGHTGAVVIDEPTLCGEQNHESSQ